MERVTRAAQHGVERGSVELRNQQGSVAGGPSRRRTFLLVAVCLGGLVVGVAYLASRAQAAPSSIRFASVSAGAVQTCGVRADETVVCWGDDRSGKIRPPGGTFKSVSAGTSFTCGVRSDETVACWGEDEYGQARPPAGKFRSVSAGEYYRFSRHRCGQGERRVVVVSRTFLVSGISRRLRTDC